MNSQWLNYHYKSIILLPLSIALLLFLPKRLPVFNKPHVYKLVYNLTIQTKALIIPRCLQVLHLGKYSRKFSSLLFPLRLNFPQLSIMCFLPQWTIWTLKYCYVAILHHEWFANLLSKLKYRQQTKLFALKYTSHVWCYLQRSSKL